MSESNYKNNFIRIIKDWINANPGTAVGIVIGLILGILLFSLGIFKTILLLLFTLLGYWLGRNKDKNESLINTVMRIFKRNE